MLQAFGLGSPEEAINTQLVNGSDTLRILGVVKNFAWYSLKEADKPFVLALNRESTTFFAIKFEAESDLSPMNDYIRETYTSFFQGNPLDYFFQEAYFNRQYQAERQFGNILGIFTVVAILLASLGLLGLVIFSCSRRLKEICVRKIMGASINSIFLLISKEFMLLIFIASLFGLPLAYISCHQWLNNFAHRISLESWFFLYPVIILLIISLMTISFQILRVARSNPADILRTE